MRGFRTAAQLALALLTAGSVLLALAGPRLALASRTDALRRLLAGTPASATSLQVSASWNDIASAQAQAYGTSLQQSTLTDAAVSGVTSQLHDDFTTGPLRPAPVSQAWAGMTTNELDVADLLPSLHGQGAQLELIYRTPFTSYAALVAGRYPGLPSRAPTSRTTPAGSVVLDVAVSQQTAARFGLRPGSVIHIKARNLGVHVLVQLHVTGVIKPRLPGSTFWTTDPTAAQPTQIAPPLTGNPPYWIGAVFVAPAEAVLLEQSFGARMTATWMLPLTFPGIRGDQAQALYDALNRVTSQAPELSGKLAPASDALQVSSGLLSPLQGFLATVAAIGTLQWLLAASLAVSALVTLLLAGWMVALRRDPELTMLRARGASLRQVGWVVLRDAAVACVPAAALASAVALLTIPGETPSGSLAWWPAVVVTLTAACAPAVAGTWRQRLPRRRRARRSARARMTVRLAAEVTVCALAIAALVVLREHGASAANLFTSAVPALVAIPVVIVEQRLFPLVLRGALRIAARRRGATAFLALAGATRTALTPALPTFALVVALTVAAFGGMTRDAISNGEIAASWRAVGADVSIAPGAAQGNGTLAPAVINGMMQPNVIKAIASVPGVRHASGFYQGAWDTPAGQQITGIAVDPASYAALIASEPDYWPPFPAGLLGGEPGAPGQHVPAAAVPVLASPDMAAALGTGAVTLGSQFAQPVRVRVAGVITSAPALPVTGSFVVLPISALRPISEPVEPNVLLLTGPGIDRAALATVLSKDLAGGVATFRSDELTSLADAPLQHGTYDLFDVAIVASAVLGLTVLLLVLALGAAGRELTLARLATMGLSTRQRARLVALEVGPAVLAAAAAGIACALALPPELGPVIDLSVFTGGPGGRPPGTAQPGSTVAVPFAADAAAIGLPVAALAVLAGIALLIETRAGRRRGAYGIAPLMRGE